MDTFVKVEAALATAPYAATPTWTDITGQVQRASLTRKRAPNGVTVPTRMQIQVDNVDARWDMASTNTTSPYDGNVIRDKLIHVSVSSNGFSTETALSTCLLDDVRLNAGPFDANAVLYATDWLRILAEYQLDDWVRPVELVGDRVTALFSEVGIPDGTGGQADFLGVVNNGTVMVAARTYSGSALAVAQEMTRSERGLLWTQANGNLSWRDRYHIIDRTEFNTSQVTLDEDGDLMGPVIRSEASGTKRKVTAVVASGDTGTQIKYDSTPAADNPTTTDRAKGMPVLFDSDVGMLAETIQKQREVADDVTKPRSVRCWVVSGAASNTNVLSAIVNEDIDLFNAVTLTYRPVGWSSDYTYVARIEGIRHQFRKDAWFMTLDLGPYSTTWQTASANFYEFAATLAGTDRLAL